MTHVGEKQKRPKHLWSKLIGIFFTRKLIGICKDKPGTFIYYIHEFFLREFHYYY